MPGGAAADRREGTVQSIPPRTRGRRPELYDDAPSGLLIPVTGSAAMTSRQRDGTRSAVLALSLALGGEWTVHAQDVSSGSGVGTGAGGAMSRARTGAGGAMSGAATGAGGAMSGRGAGPSDLGGTALPLGPRQGTVPFGPGVDVS